MRQMKKIFSLIIVLTLFIQTVSGLFVGESHAAGEGLNIIQSVSPLEIGPEEEVEVLLSYSTESGTGSFFNVLIEYEIPKGAVFLDIGDSQQVKAVKYYNSEGNEIDGTNKSLVKKVTFSLRDAGTGDDGIELSAGANGDVKVYFEFPLPSEYPNGAEITLNKGIMTGNKGVAEGDPITTESGVFTLDYILGKSWSISKSGPTNLIISNNPLQTVIEATYTIALTGGNIPLKDVTITDILPANASYKSTTESSALDATVPGQLSWHFDDILATGKSLSVTLEYAIAREIDDLGVRADESRTNTVSVTGYPVQIQDDGSYIKVTEEDNAVSDPFVTKSDDATTNFSASTAKWEVETTGTQNVTLSQDPTDTTVDVNYQVKISGGDTDLKQATMIYTIPDDATVISSEGGSEGVNTITWSGINIDADDFTTRNIVLRYPIDRTVGTNDNGVDDGVDHGESRTNTVTASGFMDDGKTLVATIDPATDDITTNFYIYNGKWSISKWGSNNLVVKNRDEGGDPGSTYVDITYGIKLNSNSYLIPLKNVVITDTLPLYATYRSDTSGQVPVQALVDGHNTLTWTFAAAADDSKPNFNVTIRYAIDRDGTPDTGYIVGNSISNIADVSAHTIDGDGEDSGVSYNFGSGSSSTKSTTFISPAVPQPQTSINIEKLSGVNYSKDGSDLLLEKNFDTGDAITYVLDFNNTIHNNEDLREVVLLEDNLPEVINFKQIDLGKSTDSILYDFYYTVDGSTWINQGEHNTNSNETVDIEALLGAGEKLKGIKFAYKSNIPTDFTLSEKIKLKGALNSEAENDVIYGTTLELLYKYRIFEAVSTEKQKSASVRFRFLHIMAWISEMNKTLVTAGTHKGGDTLEYQLEVTNHLGLATDDFDNPVLVDVLPDGFSYIEVTDFSSSKGVDGLTEPHQIIREDYPNQGETTVLWYWDDGSVLKDGETITLNYEAMVKSYAGVGNHINKFYMYGLGRYSSPMSYIADANNFDEDDLTTQLLKGDEETTRIEETASMVSVLWVKGELDEEYSKYPDVGKTIPGGLADYRFEVENTSNIFAKEVEIVDILPFDGDAYTLSVTSRGSEWRPYMIRAIEAGNVDIITDVHGNVSSADLKVYYSKESDPIRKTADGNTIGTKDPDWSLIPPSDMSTVRSLKFVVDNFSENGTVGGESNLLKPGSIISIGWEMRAPVGTPADIVAWNSISQHPLIVDVDGDSRFLLLAEPNKVGIEVEVSTAGEIGDYVWLDPDRDGIQQEDEVGVNGVVARLHQKVEGVWEEIKITSTGDNVDGEPGYYLFPNLEAGEYYVSFSPPEGIGYVLTDGKQGSDRSLDSNGYKEEGAIRTEPITLGNGVTDYNFDLGLFEANMSIRKVGSRTNFTSVGTMIDYEITVTNNGPAILHGIVVQDPLIELYDSIEVLAVGEFKTYEGTYTVTSSDVSARKVLNTAVADSEETEEEIAEWTVKYKSPYVPTIPEPEPEPEEPAIEYERDDPDPDPEEKLDEEPEEIVFKPNKEVEEVEVVKQPEHGKVTISDDGEIIYTPDETFEGKDKFTVVVLTPDGEEEEITFEIDDDFIPESVVDELPKTGGVPLGYYFVFGILVFALGIKLKR